MLSVPQAMDVFAESFSYTRSLTYPVEVVDIGPLRVLRDGPRRKTRRRNEEIIVPPGSSPEEVVRQIQNYQPQGRYVLDVFQAADETAGDSDALYKRHGFRRLGTEPLMVRALDCLPAASARHDVQRIETQIQADTVAKAARSKLIRPEHLSSSAPAVRAYYVEKDGKIAAWAHTVSRQADACYLAGIFTDPAFRRQGIASALLHALCTDHAQSGAAYNVLLASRLGSLLYASFGYTQIGSLFMYAQKRERA